MTNSAGRPSRRVVLSAVAAGAMVGGGYAVGRLTAPQVGEGASAGSTSIQAVAGTGIHQAGVVNPSDAQPHGVFTSYDVDADSTSEIRGLLAGLGETVLQLTAPGTTVPGVTDDGAGDLTITVGLGPRLVAIAGRDLPGAAPLPRFDGDGNLPDRLRGGDMLLAIQANDAGLPDAVRDHLEQGRPKLSVRWEQRGFRGLGNGQFGVARNVIGYLDGVVVPRTPAELDAHVWITSGPARHGTICVLRRLVVDVDRFRAETDERQGAIIGRHRGDGSPLSGGRPMDQVDLTAKTPDGQYVIPAHAHARAAHPSFTGSSLMLRGSYSFDNGPRERGTLFRCFQRDLDTFVKTQRRLDEVDDLMGYVQLTATGSYLILPGFDEDHPLGSTLLG
jgi:deferrochelatase/peroxidase EfeB